MLNAFRSSWLFSAWIAAVAIIVAVSIAMGANLLTTALLLTFGIAPAIVVALLMNGEPSASVAQILHSAETKDAGRP